VSWSLKAAKLAGVFEWKVFFGWEWLVWVCLALLQLDWGGFWTLAGGFLDRRDQWLFF
jgi:hypothetical protein